MLKLQQDFYEVSDFERPLQFPDRPIALVDDSPDDRLFLKREVRFVFGNVPIVAFQSGAELLAHLRDPAAGDQKPWLILLDVNMPGMGGFKTLECLGRDAAAADIPVVVVSGTLNERDVHESFSLGAKAFLPKPVSRQAFAALLHQRSIFRAPPRRDPVARAAATGACA